MEEFIVTLRVKLDTINHTPTTPAEWDWQSLLDLAPNEEVEVLNQFEVESEEV